TSHGGYNIAEAGTYGTLYVNSASGAYEFIPNDAAINALPAAATEHFTVTVTDPAGNTAHQDFAVALTGVNDAPVVVGNTSTASVPTDMLTSLAASYLVAGHDLVNKLGGAAGFGENSLGPNDDGSTPAINITSVFGSEGLNFFGTHFTSLYVNNNGNITFNSPNGEYTPQHIDAGAGNPIIAPFWADVDTRGGAATATTGGHSTGSNLVYYDLDAANHVFTVTWDDVGYYNHHTNLLDAFQLQLVGTGYGNFDIVFRYESINWTTGDASGGSGGLGGDIARAGYSAGDGIAGHYYELSGSGLQNAMLALSSTPGDTGVAGVQVFEVNSGIVTGASAAS
ncbi:MAG TPA: nidogen-like domain-containing protein, partial [Mycobacterium sp.]|nr:nidogen-like domain-containing protein [Mycobacterium sp.]